MNKASLYSYQAEKENSMGKFDEIRKIMKEFKGDMDSLASNKIKEGRKMISVTDVLTIFITGFIAGGLCNYIHCLEREENR